MRSAAGVVARRDQRRIRRRAGPEAFAQSPDRHQLVVQIALVNHQQVDVTAQLEMLKPIIEQVDARAQPLFGQPSREIPTGTNEYRHAR